MNRRTVRICLVGGLLALFGVVSLRTPGLWHVHVGGEVAHRHGDAPPIPGETPDHGPAGSGHSHSHSHSHNGHRHAHGGRRHTHHEEHSTGPENPAHAAPAGSPAAHDAIAGAATWHVHFSLFGFEWTLRSQAPAGAAKSSETVATVSHGKSGRRSMTRAFAPSPVGMAFSEDPGRGGTRFLALESGPLPKGVGFPRSNDSRLLVAEPFFRTGRDAARPPLPPPRGDGREISCRIGR